MPPSTDFDTTRPVASWWVAWYAKLLPVVAIHWRSCTTTPSSGCAVHVFALSVEHDTVALPSHRSVVHGLPVVWSAAVPTSVSAPARHVSRRMIRMTVQRRRGHGLARHHMTRWEG